MFVSSVFQGLGEGNQVGNFWPFRTLTCIVVIGEFRSGVQFLIGTSPSCFLCRARASHESYMYILCNCLYLRLTLIKLADSIVR